MKGRRKRRRKAPKSKIRPSRKRLISKETAGRGFYGAALKAASRALSKGGTSPKSMASKTDIGSMFGEIDSSVMPPVDFTMLERSREQRDRQIEEKLSKLKARAGVRRVLFELSRAGINERDVIPYLSCIWQACRNQPRRLANVPGVPLKDIRRLPNILRGVARQINAINEHRAMPSAFWFRIRKELPGSLYGYALDLERKLSGSVPKAEGAVCLLRPDNGE